MGVLLLSMLLLLIGVFTLSAYISSSSEEEQMILKTKYPLASLLVDILFL